MSRYCWRYATHSGAVCIATLAAILLAEAPAAQAGEVVTRDCLHGSAENHSFSYGSQYDEAYGRDYGDRHSTDFSYTRPDTVLSQSGNFRGRRGFGFRRGLVTNSIDPNGGGAISGASAGSSGGYRIGTSSGSGAGSRTNVGDDSCVEIHRELVNPYIIQVPPPHAQKDVADLAARERLWQAHCRPVIREDIHGVRRYRYAAPGCDYGRYE